jgi:hypothetical protein
MTAEEYEDFFRKGLKLSSRNKELGADADFFRELESSYAVYTTNHVPDEKLKDKTFQIPAELAAYNALAIKISQFLLPVLDKYMNDFYLNGEQISELSQLKTAVQKTPTFEKIVEVIERAKEVMKSSVKVNVVPSGFMATPQYTYYVHETYNKYIHHLNGLEELEIILYEIPYSIIGKYQYLAPRLSQDGKKLSITIAENKFYSPKGAPAGAPKPFEVFMALERRLSDAVKLYDEWTKANPKHL